VFDQPAHRPGWLRARVIDPEIVRRYDLAHPSARAPSPAAAAVAELLLEQVRQMVASGAWQARLL
ncbi:MAG: LysR family transcriptional regulator, partial [Burkholderiales bacterium]|nr:LysR family transcriptional regulator [Burkholderiales bacterium]